MTDEREAYLARYRELVEDRLPAVAAAEGWVLRANHCFGRILLDDAQLARAVAQGERLLAEGDPLVRELDARSLRWRGKPPK